VERWRRREVSESCILCCTGRHQNDDRCSGGPTRESKKSEFLASELAFVLRDVTSKFSNSMSLEPTMKLVQHGLFFWWMPFMLRPVVF